MNPSDQPPPPLPAAKNDVPRFSPMEGADTVTGLFETLLKHPGSIIHRMHQDGILRPLACLAGIAIVSFIVFGALIGTFALGQQLWAAPLKITLGIVFSALICLPSLYIFTCLSGLSARFSSVAGILAAVVALTGLLLLGFSPVVWIFSQSTSSPVFMGALVLIFWIISLSVGLSLLPKMVSFGSTSGSPYLRIWIVIFVIVTLQMSTSLRPLIAPEEDSTFLPTEKKFFLEHWVDQIGR
ncbi:MAG: hypothetical protein KDN22_25205 [Verrucomicrobiae bacterium]|nr:hypothetical protein [Verrucomicrobiae bacterium]